MNDTAIHMDRFCTIKQIIIAKRHDQRRRNDFMYKNRIHISNSNIELIYTD
jgi:hypothetical protein